MSDGFTLHQNYPNPFNPTTTLKYDLPKDAMVNITIYDMMGRVVRTMVNSQQNAGYQYVGTLPMTMEHQYQQGYTCIPYRQVISGRLRK